MRNTSRNNTRAGACKHNNSSSQPCGLEPSVNPAHLSYCCSLRQTNGAAHALTMRAVSVKTLSQDVYEQFWAQKATKWELNIPWRDL